MFDDQILGTLFSIWMGFALALQLRTTIEQNNVLKKLYGQPERGRFLLVLLIYSGVGLAGAFGFAWLIGHVSQFKDPAFPVGLIVGLSLFIVTIFLTNGNKMK